MSFWTDNINNLVQDHQNEITKHMGRFGVHHGGRRWNHRDLWNGYRAFGSPFLNGLGTLVTNLFGQGGALGQNSGVWGHRVSPQLAQATGTNEIDGQSLTSTLPGIGSYMGYTGDEFSNATGPDYRRDERDRHRYFNRYMQGQPLPMPFYGTPWIGLGDGGNEAAQYPAAPEMPAPEDKILGIQKKTFFVLMAVLVLVFLYFKFRK